MIDIHSHILPGLDDGPQEMKDAVAMARLAVKGGIRKMICTPHWHPAVWPNTKNPILNATARFRKALADARVPLEVFPGCELSLEPGLEEKLDEGALLTLNDGRRWVLLELPVEILPQGLEDYFWRIQSRGYRIVLAHVERHPVAAAEPERLYDWVQMGVTAQITASSLLGRLGPEIVEVCINLLEHRLVHFIASDTHGPRRRRPMLAPAVRAAAEILGKETARRLVHTHPQAVLNGRGLDLDEYAPVPIRKRRKSFWARLLGKR